MSGRLLDVHRGVAQGAALSLVPIELTMRVAVQCILATGTDVDKAAISEALRAEGLLELRASETAAQIMATVRQGAAENEVVS